MARRRRNETRRAHRAVAVGAVSRCHDQACRVAERTLAEELAEESDAGHVQTGRGGDSAAHCPHAKAGLALLAVVLMAGTSAQATQAAARTYAWTAGVAVAPPEHGRQRAETALAGHGDRLWLSYLDAAYGRRSDSGSWVAWPRKVTLFTSPDQGKNWQALPNLSEMGGDEALTTDQTGALYAGWIRYFYDADKRLKQRAAVARVGADGKAGPLIECLPWEPLSTAHDQTSLASASGSGIHVVATDIHPRHRGQPQLLYARATAEGTSCQHAQRLGTIGALPQAGETTAGLVIAGPKGYVTSADGGGTFSPPHPRPFADKLARLAVSPDRTTVYVTGDSAWNGIWVHASEDGGRTWRRTEVVRIGPAKGWRFPVVHADKTGRVHVVWMEDGAGIGALYHAHSGDRGKTFSPPVRISDTPFPFPAKAPPPPPGTQDGSWIGDYIALTSTKETLIVAWSDQRAGPSLATVYVTVGRIAE